MTTGQAQREAERLLREAELQLSVTVREPDVQLARTKVLIAQGWLALASQNPSYA